MITVTFTNEEAISIIDALRKEKKSLKRRFYQTNTFRKSSIIKSEVEDIDNIIKKLK